MSAARLLSENLSDRRAGTVIHVGAGDGHDLDDYRDLDCERLVLAEGSRDALARLRTGVGELPRAEVVDVVLSADGADAVWHGFNWSALDGLVHPKRLQSVYPGLRRSDARTVATTELREWLESLQVGESGHRGHALVLDIPGQEMALLQTLPPTLLTRFDWVVVHGCSERTSDEGCSFDETAQWLAERHYERAPSTDHEPMWPKALFRLNRAALGLSNAERRNADLEYKLTTLQETTAELRRDRDGSAGALDAARRRIVEVESQVLEVTRQRADATRREAALEVELAGVKRQLAEAVATSSVQAERLAALVVERDEHARRRQAHADREGALQCERDELALRLLEARAALERCEGDRQILAAEARRLHDEASLSAASVVAAEEKLAQSARRLEEAVAANGEQAARIAALTTERDEQAHWHQENAKWAKALQAESQALQRQLDDANLRLEQSVREAQQVGARHEQVQRDVEAQAACQRRLEAEILKAQAQLSLMKDVLIREKNF